MRDGVEVPEGVEEGVTQPYGKKWRGTMQRAAEGQAPTLVLQQRPSEPERSGASVGTTTAGPKGILAGPTPILAGRAAVLEAPAGEVVVVVVRVQVCKPVKEACC